MSGLVQAQLHVLGCGRCAVSAPTWFVVAGFDCDLRVPVHTPALRRMTGSAMGCGLKILLQNESETYLAIFLDRDLWVAHRGPAIYGGLGYGHETSRRSVTECGSAITGT